MKKIIWGLMLGFLFLLPTLPAKAQSNPCTAGGGTCVDYSLCSTTLNGGIGCSGTGVVCCDPSAVTPPTPSPTADAYQEGSTGGFLLLRGHLVPCGRNSDDPGTTNINETEPCTLCHLFLLLKNIFDLMLSLLIVTAILFITVGGVVYIVSMGNSRLTGIAKDIITKTLIGFGLMMAGWLLVYTLLVFLSAGNMIGSENTGNWFDFTCESESRFNQPSGSSSFTPTPGNWTEF